MSRRIPPLNPLRVFVTVARTENLTRAAQELHVSQSAVSRQIATLESYLGIELFRRDRHGVTLTRAGRTYGERVLPAFEQIAAATEQLLKGSRQGALRVRTYTTFAAKWLIPRLPDFNARHPDIEVKLNTAVPDVDFDRDAADCAIQFGHGKWPSVHAELMFVDLIEPVCSPALLARLPARTSRANRPRALLAQRLLVSHYRRTDWDDWLAATGHAALANHAERMTFPSSVLTWQAAEEGLGLAIGQTRLLQPELASGQLVRPFEQPVERGLGYYLLVPTLQREPRKVQVFRQWLHDCVAAQQAGTAT